MATNNRGSSAIKKYVQIPNQLIKKLKSEPGGLGHLMESIKKYGVDVEFDYGAYQLVGEDHDLLEIVLSTLDHKYIKPSAPDNGVVQIVENKMVKWKFHGEDAKLLKNMFSEELNNLSTLSCVVRQLDITPLVVEISCEPKMNQRIKMEIDKLRQELEQLTRVNIKVSNTKEITARQFAASHQGTDTLCYIHYNPKNKELQYFGRTSESVQIALDKWQTGDGKQKSKLVKWKFHGEDAKLLKNIFSEELNNLSTLSCVVRQLDITPLVVEISCEPKMNQRIKMEIDKLRQELEQLTRVNIKVSNTKEITARQFAASHQGTDTLCYIHYNPKNKELQYFGRTSESVQIALDTWQTGDGKQKSKPGIGMSPSLTKAESQKHVTNIDENIKTLEATVRELNTKPIMTQLHTSVRDRPPPTQSPKTDTYDPGHYTGHEDGSSAGHVTQLSASVKQTARDRPLLMPASREETRSQGHSGHGTGAYFNYEFTCGTMDVKVYNESITDIRGMDAIVNAANEQLAHGGGVAYYISKAAGVSIDTECRQFVSRHGPLYVTDNFVSGPGRMNCKGIIHAVGPQWYDYVDAQEDCARDLYKTIMNILEEAGKRRYRKIAMPVISAGVFGVPNPLCAEMYVKSFIDFDRRSPGRIAEVHFIDIDPGILGLVKSAYEESLRKPNSLDFQNARKYPSARRPVRSTTGQ